MGKQGCVIAAASLAGWLGGGLAGCGFDSTPMGSAVCVDGQSAECACEDGSRGLHSCSQGEFGACACGPEGGADTDAPPDVGSASGSSANGSGSAGSSGGAIDGAAGASAGTAGSAAAPSAGAGATAGSGAPHPGGEGGSTGDAGSGGSAGAAGSDGGAGGRGGSGGGDPIPAPPGTAYGFCAAQADCSMNGLVCTVSLDSAASGYCAPFCMFNGGGGGGAGGCEQPKSGEVVAQCAPLVGMCLLTACQNKDCPARMECVQTTLPFGQQDVASNCRYLTK